MLCAVYSIAHALDVRQAAMKRLNAQMIESDAGVKPAVFERRDDCETLVLCAHTLSGPMLSFRRRAMSSV